MMDVIGSVIGLASVSRRLIGLKNVNRILKGIDE